MCKYYTYTVRGEYYGAQLTTVDTSYRAFWATRKSMFMDGGLCDRSGVYTIEGGSATTPLKRNTNGTIRQP